MYICIYIYVHIYTHIHIFITPCRCVETCAQVDPRVYLWCLSINKHMLIDPRVCLYILSSCTFVALLSSTRAYTPRGSTVFSCVCRCLCIHVCLSSVFLYIYLYTYTHTHTHTHIRSVFLSFVDRVSLYCLSVHIYVHIYVHIHTRRHTHTHESRIVFSCCRHTVRG